MVQYVRDLMTSNPITLAPTATVRQAAQAMRDNDIGTVIVADGEHVQGIVTDRDLVVRALADRTDLADCHLDDVCSSAQLITATPDEQVESAVRRMRENSVRRIPVVEGDHAVGVLSLGDAAIERDSGSALADISAASGNT